MGTRLPAPLYLSVLGLVVLSWWLWVLIFISVLLDPHIYDGMGGIGAMFLALGSAAALALAVLLYALGRWVVRRARRRQGMCTTCGGKRVEGETRCARCAALLAGLRTLRPWWIRPASAKALPLFAIALSVIGFAIGVWCAPLLERHGPIIPVDLMRLGMIVAPTLVLLATLPAALGPHCAWALRRQRGLCEACGAERAGSTASACLACGCPAADSAP